MKIKNVLAFALIALAFASCGNKKNQVSLASYADTANYFAGRIADLEAKQQQSMDDMDLFLKLSDSAMVERQKANEVLTQMFSKESDTLFLPFEQTKNIDKIEILSVWITAMEFDKILIEARVKAIDNSSFMGPHAGLVVKDRKNEELEVGGGIQGPTDDKLEAGKVYTFSGKIEHLHLLSQFRMLMFNEDIKKW